MAEENVTMFQDPTNIYAWPEDGTPCEVAAFVFNKPKATDVAAVAVRQQMGGMRMAHYIVFDNGEVVMIFEKKEKPK